MIEMHDIAKLPKWVQKLIANLRSERAKPAIIGSGTLSEAKEEISKYLNLGFRLHTFVSIGQRDFGSSAITQEFRTCYAWVLINPNVANNNG